MLSDFEQINALCNGGWIIISIVGDGDDRYTVEVKNEGDVNNYKDFTDGKATLSVTKTEAEELSNRYGVPLS